MRRYQRMTQTPPDSIPRADRSCTQRRYASFANQGAVSVRVASLLVWEYLLLQQVFPVLTPQAWCESFEMVCNGTSLAKPTHCINSYLTEKPNSLGSCNRNLRVRVRPPQERQLQQQHQTLTRKYDSGTKSRARKNQHLDTGTPNA